MTKIENFDEKLRQTIDKIKSQINKSTGVEFLFVDKGQSSDPTKKHEILKTKLQDSFADSLFNLFEEKINKLEEFYSINSKMPKFLSVTSPDKPSYFQPSDITFMKEFVENLDSAGNIYDFKLREKFTGYGIHITIPKNNVFCFTNVSKKSITKFKENTFAVFFKPNYNEGILEYAPNDLYVIDKDIHCIYFQSLDTFVVLDRDLTGKLFGFKDYYDWVSKKQINELEKQEMIEIDSQTKTALKNHPELQMKIAQMRDQGQFKKGIDYYKRADLALKKFVEDGMLDQTKFDFTMKDNKVLTNSIIRMSSYLAVTAERVTRHLLYSDVLLLASWVEQITRRARPIKVKPKK